MIPGLAWRRAESLEAQEEGRDKKEGRRRGGRGCLRRWGGRSRDCEPQNESLGMWGDASRRPG